MQSLCEEHFRVLPDLKQTKHLLYNYNTNEQKSETEDKASDFLNVKEFQNMTKIVLQEG